MIDELDLAFDEQADAGRAAGTGAAPSQDARSGKRGGKTVGRAS